MTADLHDRVRPKHRAALLAAKLPAHHGGGGLVYEHADAVTGRETFARRPRGAAMFSDGTRPPGQGCRGTVRRTSPAASVCIACDTAEQPALARGPESLHVRAQNADQFGRDWHSPRFVCGPVLEATF